MRYHVLVTDYDGTLALHGKVPDHIIESLRQVKASSRKLILVTGRILEDLKMVFPEYSVFDLIVAENGALVYDPSTNEEKLLGELPPAGFIGDLSGRKVEPLSVGKVIVATWEPHQNTVLEAIRAAGIEYQVIFNKGAVMILPPGINKAKGLKAALLGMGISLHNAVAIGDAENDGAMLRVVECAAAVANALQSVKDESDIVTSKDHGEGVAELIEALLKDDLRQFDERLERHYLPLGKREDGSPVKISPYSAGMLVIGASGSGKTTFTVAFLENLLSSEYQFCLIDPEGDYEKLPGIAALGDADHAPAAEEALKLLENPSQSVVICILAIPLDDRPAFVKKLMTGLLEMRTNKGHPHWLIFDEAHHLMPAALEPSFFNIPDDFNNFLMITNAAGQVSQSFLEHVDTVITIGKEPQKKLSEYAGCFDMAPPEVPPEDLEKGKAVIWNRKSGGNAFKMAFSLPRQLLQRHKRKYAMGDLGPASFYFRGAEGKLRLKAQNLIIFIQIAEGVDDETWMYHLKRKDYSKWLRESVSDEELAASVEAVEEREQDAGASRSAIRKLIEDKYTAPAD